MLRAKSSSLRRDQCLVVEIVFANRRIDLETVYGVGSEILSENGRAILKWAFENVT